VVMSPEEKKEEETKIGATSALGKITQAGYSSLDVRRMTPLFVPTLIIYVFSSSAISLAGLMRSVHGLLEGERKRPRPPESSSSSSLLNNVS
jgi:hypothetical protein